MEHQLFLLANQKALKIQYCKNPEKWTTTYCKYNQPSTLSAKRVILTGLCVFSLGLTFNNTPHVIVQLH